MIDRKLLGIVAVLAAVVFAASLQSANFLSGGNLETLLYRTSLYGIISIGAAFVIVTGGIDLSIGSMICLVGLSLPYLTVGCGWPVAVAVPVALGLSIALGWFHGFLVTRLDLQPFVVTLCGLLLYRGIARWITEDRSLGFGTGEYSWMTDLVETRWEIAGGFACGSAQHVIRSARLVADGLVEIGRRAHVILLRHVELAAAAIAGSMVRT